MDKVDLKVAEWLCNPPMDFNLNIEDHYIGQCPGKEQKYDQWHNKLYRHHEPNASTVIITDWEGYHDIGYCETCSDVYPAIEFKANCRYCGDEFNWSVMDGEYEYSRTLSLQTILQDLLDGRGGNSDNSS